MTDSFSEYLENAKTATGTKSDSNMARKIGISRALLHAYKTGKAPPSEQAMIALAKRANLDETEALILLNLWKSEGDAKAIYKRLLMSQVVQATKGSKKFGATLGLAALILSPLGGIMAEKPNNSAVLGLQKSAAFVSHKTQNNKHYAIYSRISIPS